MRGEIAKYTPGMWRGISSFMNAEKILKYDIRGRNSLKFERLHLYKKKEPYLKSKPSPTYQQHNTLGLGVVIYNVYTPLSHHGKTVKELAEDRGVRLGIP